ncbi:MAG: glycosyltransferase [Fibrobacteria bacterium]
MDPADPKGALMIPFDPALIIWILVTMAAAVMLMGTFLNFLSAPRLEKALPPLRSARVSLLIPFRDEEANLRVLMPMLRRIEYPELEILLLDDDSRDASAEIVAAEAKADELDTGALVGAPVGASMRASMDASMNASSEAPVKGRIRLLHGEPLPAGWLGKNWACSQLAAQATGEILIFCDADVRAGPRSVAATVGMMQSEKWDALTAMPRQLLGTWSEKAVIPILLFMPVLGFLPISFIPRYPHPSLSVGCGQWFAFTRPLYLRLGGHGAVREQIVEDMALGRLVKEKRGVLGAVIATRDLSVRMYTGFPSVWMGFAKNLAYLTGTGWIRPAFVVSGFLALNALPWIMVVSGHWPWLIPFCLWSAARFGAARIFREPGFAWIWSWAGTLLIPALCIRSWWGHRRGSMQWKGRELDAAFAKNRPG